MLTEHSAHHLNIRSTFKTAMIVTAAAWLTFSLWTEMSDLLSATMQRGPAAGFSGLALIVLAALCGVTFPLLAVVTFVVDIRDYFIRIPGPRSIRRALAYGLEGNCEWMLLVVIIFGPFSWFFEYVFAVSVAPLAGPFSALVAVAVGYNVLKRSLPITTSLPVLSAVVMLILGAGHLDWYSKT